VPFRGGTGPSFTVMLGGLILSQHDAGHVRPDVAVFRAGPGELRSLGVWRSPAVGSYTVAIAPACADGRLFLRTHDGIWCYDVRPPGAK